MRVSNVGMSSQLRAVLITGAAGFTSFFTLFAAVPAIADDRIGSIGAGIATGSLLTATVLTQLAVPYLMRRVGAAWLMAAALILLGAPSIIYAFDTPVWLFLFATILRGAGFGLLTIVSTSLAAHYAPAGKRGTALGWLGLVTALAGVVMPGLGVWLLENVSAAFPAVIAVASGLIGVLVLAPIHRASAQPISKHQSATASFAGPRLTQRHLLIPLVMYLPASMTYGVIYTFLPKASVVAPIALVTFGAGYALGRTYGGRWADHLGVRQVLLPATALSALFAAGLYWSSLSWLVIIVGLLLGTTIGTSATASLAAMMHWVNTDGYARASAAWNINFDVGIALGGALIGFVVAMAGFGGAVIACASALTAVTVVGLFGLQNSSAKTQSSAT